MSTHATPIEMSEDTSSLVPPFWRELGTSVGRRLTTPVLRSWGGDPQTCDACGPGARTIFVCTHQKSANWKVI